MRPLRWLNTLSCLLLLTSCASVGHARRLDPGDSTSWRPVSYPSASARPVMLPPATVSHSERFIVEVVSLTNQERAAQGLPPLRLDDALTRAAQGHAANMARQGQMSHELDGHNVSDRVSAAGFRWRYVAENIAEGQRTPEEVMQSWMESTGHRRNILSKRADFIGVGVARSGRQLYWCQVFARGR